MKTFKNSIFRILRTVATQKTLNQNTVGTGFLVSGNLVITCGHLLVSGDTLDADNQVTVCFYGSKTLLEAHWLFELQKGKYDVAFLRLSDPVPLGIEPLLLDYTRNENNYHYGDLFHSFGYATVGRVQGISVNGVFDDYLDEHSLVQLQTPQADHGVSGAPMLDEKYSAVIGMLASGNDVLGKNQNTAFAIPIKIILDLYPELRLYERGPLAELAGFIPEIMEIRDEILLIYKSWKNGTWEEMSVENRIIRVCALLPPLERANQSIKETLQKYPDFEKKNKIQISLRNTKVEYENLENAVVLSDKNILTPIMLLVEYLEKLVSHIRIKT